MKEITIGCVAFVFVMIFLVVLFFGYPYYRVWSMGLRGQATLAQAEYEKKVAVESAKAELESAKLKADAEIVRAEGIAKANEIIGDSLQGKDEYLRWLYIDKLDQTQNQIIYIPTEAGLPLLEATRNTQR